MFSRIFIYALDHTMLSLTPMERWEAARKFGSLDFFSETWFILTGLIIVAVLLVALILTRSGRRLTDRRRSQRLFDNYANRRGLSDEEKDLLQRIAEKAGLKRSESIFTISSAFDRGATELIEGSFAREDFGQGKQLRSEIAFLREKLGFLRRHPISMASMRSSNTVSTRQISAGKKLYVARRGGRAFRDVEAMVTRIDDSEITVKLREHLDLTPGDLLCAHYYFGISVWEFDTSVLRTEGDMVILSHSDNIRFINRRRFLRVPVKKSAFIAHFPFRKVFTMRNLGAEKNQDNSESKADDDENEGENSDEFWGIPELVPAVVTELAGPGLRIKTPLELKAGERVLVILKLNEIKEIGPNDEVPEEIKTIEVVEDIGRIKHITALKDGFSVAVELEGLSDADISELVRATNSESVQNGKITNSSGSSSKKKKTVQKATTVGRE